VFSTFRCRYIDYLQQQAKPTEVNLADDEFILHVEGSTQTQKVVRHIGASSWPGFVFILFNVHILYSVSGLERLLVKESNTGCCFVLAQVG
jgi:hypothetical protein